MDCNQNKILKYAIVGFGCAGYNAAAAIRSCDKNAEIHVFERTSDPPFNPMLTTYLASGALSEGSVFPFGNTEEIARRYQLIMHAPIVVKRVHVNDKAVELEDGSVYRFDKILIATGARAMMPSSLDCSHNHVFLMRTLKEARLLHDYIETGIVKKAVVAGGSMVAIKVAQLLYQKNVEVSMVYSTHLFTNAAYPEIAEEIEQRLKEKGIHIVKGSRVKEITKNGVRLADGREVEGTVVCLCMGTLANIELVANTEVVDGEQIIIDKGIVIDSNARSNCKDIYAAGDCSEGIELQSGKPAVIGLWANAGAQGRCAGRNMAGKSTDYYGNILHNITHFFDMDFIGLGDPKLDGKKYTFRNDDFTISIVKKGKQLQSVNILGNYSISGILKNHLTKQLMGGGTRLSDVEKGLLRKSGLSDEFLRKIDG